MNYPIPQPVGYTTETGDYTLAIRGQLTREPIFVGHTGHYGAIRDWLNEKIKQGAENLILDIDSCGGDVSGLSGLAHEIRNNSAKIIAHITGLAASAAYCIASACDEIEAEKDSVIGAIGSYVNSPKKPETVVISERTPLKLDGGDQLQVLANASGDQFLLDVAEFRGFDSNDLDKVSELCGLGKLMTAQEALQRNLIDRISGVIEMPDEMKEEKKEEIVEKEAPEPQKDEMEKLLDKLVERLMPEIAKMIEQQISEKGGNKEEEVKEEVVEEGKTSCNSQSLVDRSARADLKRLQLSLLKKDGIFANDEDEQVASKIYDLDRGLFKQIYESNAKTLLTRFSSAVNEKPSKSKTKTPEEKIQAIDDYLGAHPGVGFEAAKAAVEMLEKGEK